MYLVEIRPKARKYIEKPPRTVQRRVLAALTALADDPYPPASSRLTNRDTVAATYR